MGKKIKLNALDLFAGAGGFSEGIEQAGINVVAAIEFNPQIAKTYEHNHPSTKMLVDDIKNISADNIKSIFEEQGVKCNIIFGGPPCQGFLVVPHAKDSVWLVIVFVLKYHFSKMHEIIYSKNTLGW